MQKNLYQNEFDIFSNISFDILKEHSDAFNLADCFLKELLKLFTDPYCAGVSNKHCLLTFFIFIE